MTADDEIKPRRVNSK